MKKGLLILAFSAITIGLLSLLFSGFNWFLFNHTYDASNTFYQSRYKTAIIFLFIGIFATLFGVALFIIRKNSFGKQRSLSK